MSFSVFCEGCVVAIKVDHLGFHSGFSRLLQTTPICLNSLHLFPLVRGEVILILYCC
jgi:hypothetical protein